MQSFENRSIQARLSCRATATGEAFATSRICSLVKEVVMNGSKRTDGLSETQAPSRWELRYQALS